MANDWSFFSKESSHASRVLRSHHSWEDSSTIHFHQCLTLMRASEHNHVAKVLHPMTPTIYSKDTVVTLHYLHPPPLNLVPPPIFDY